MDKVHDAATQLEPVSPLNRELRTDRPYLCIGIRIDGWFQSPSKRHVTLESSRDLVGMHLQHEDIKGAMDQPRRIELATKPHRHPPTEKCVVLRHLVVPFLQGLAPETLELWQDFRNGLGDPLARKPRLEVGKMIQQERLLKGHTYHVSAERRVGDTFAIRAKELIEH